jgi:hypothetical protein
MYKTQVFEVLLFKSQHKSQRNSMQRHLYMQTHKKKRGRGKKEKGGDKNFERKEAE